MNITNYEDLKAYAQAAAALIGCEVEDLLAFRFDQEDEQFIALAPSGQKHRFEIDQLEATIAHTKCPRGMAPTIGPETVTQMIERHAREDRIEEEIATEEIWPTTPADPAPSPPSTPAPRRKAKTK